MAQQKLRQIAKHYQTRTEKTGVKYILCCFMWQPRSAGRCVHGCGMPFPTEETLPTPPKGQTALTKTIQVAVPEKKNRTPVRPQSLSYAHIS